MREFIEAYYRFRENRRKNPGIYIYPTYERDLDIILNYIEDEVQDAADFVRLVDLVKEKDNGDE